VLRLLAAEGMVSLGLLSLDGTKLAGHAAQKANRTLPQIEKILADAAGDTAEGSSPQPATPRVLARRAERRERLAGPGTGWRLRTRRAGRRRGPGSKPGTRRPRPGNPAGAARAMSRAPTGPAPSRGPTSPTRTGG
jgi:hypothetical protein